MSKASDPKDPYRLHRLALRPLLADSDKGDITSISAEVSTVGERAFLAFLHHQGLAPMWHQLLLQAAGDGPFSDEFRDALRRSRLDATGLYLAQKSSLAAIRRILEDAAIAHVVYKGADTRERNYTEPALRPAADIDVLVAERDKVAAIRAFRRHGFELRAKADIVSHEASLIKGGIAVDLHWDILRPGRTRVPIVDALLATRQDYGSHWGLDEAATLFVCLVHPVFAKYATAPQAALMRLVDLALILRKPDINREPVLQLLDRTGLKTAGWITLKWLEQLSGIAQDGLSERLQPGAIRRSYLGYWLDRNLASRLMGHPLLVQFGLTLPAHDRARDALKAIDRARKLKRSRHADLQSLLQMTQP